MSVILNPTDTSGWNLQKWQKTIEEATYQRMKFIPVVDEGDRPYNTLNIRKHQRVTGSTLAQDASGTGLTYLNIIGTPVTLTPVGSVVPVAWSENEDAQVDVNLDSEAAGNIEQALAELTESAAVANIATLTESLTVSNVDGDTFRRAYGNLMGNTNGLASPGEEPQVYGLFSHTQLPSLGTINEFNSAEVRGDSENPYIKGIWTRGGGVLLLLTTVVTESAGWWNGLFIPSAFVTAWNRRSSLIRDRAELQQRVIAYNNVGHAVKHNLRAFAVVTTANPL